MPTTISGRSSKNTTYDIMKPSETVPLALRKFFEEHERPALAFSGGADSSYLFYAAVTCGADVTAYFVKTQFQPQFELDDAERTAKWLGQDLTVIHANAIADPTVRANPDDRCYHCKKTVFGAISERARQDGKGFIMDATNASDDPAGRPGMKALSEMGIISPLRICGITKPQVRELSREAGLWTWDLPSNSCLATRIPTGMELTDGNLARTEEVEDLVRELGFRDIRVRTTADGRARFEVTDKERNLLADKKQNVEKILLAHYPGVEYATRKAGL